MVTKPTVGQPNWGPTLNAALDDLQAQISAVPTNGNFTPADHNLVFWTQDPGTLRATADATTSGSVYLMKVKVTASATVSTLYIGVITGGSVLTAGQSFVGLYTSSGTLLSASADQSANWTSAGLKTIPLLAPQAVSVGYYYVGFVSNGTTPPTLATGNGGSSAQNVGLTTGTARCLIGPAGQTSLPASIALGSQSFNIGSRWAAGS